MTKKLTGASLGLAAPGPASSFTLSDFPEVVRHEQRCTICRLIATAPQLVKSIHAEYARGLGPKVIWKSYAEAVRVAMRGEKRPSAFVFIRHLGGHVAASTTTAAAQAVQPLLDAPAAAPEVILPPHAYSPSAIARALPPLPDEPEDSPDSEFVELRGLYRKMRPIVERLAENILTLLDTPQKKAGDPEVTEAPSAVSSYDIVMLSKVYEQARGTLADLNRIKNSGRLIRFMIEESSKNLVLRVSEVFAGRISEIKTKLDRGDVEGAAADLASAVSGDILSIVADAARTTIAQSVEQYRLH